MRAILTPQRLALTAALLVTATLPAGCGDGNSGFNISRSNDILFSPKSVTFEHVKKGRDSLQKRIEISQGGETNLVIDRIYIRGYEECDRPALGLPAIGALPGELEEKCEYLVDERSFELPLTLIEAEFVELKVRYRARHDRVPAPTVLVIESNALDKETVEIPLSVLSPQPRISAPTVISFVGGAPNQKETLLVKNQGTGPLTVLDIALRIKTPQPTDPETGDPLPEFTFQVFANLEWVLAEGEGQHIEVRYDPTDAIDDEAELIITSSDPEKPKWVIRLTSAQVRSHLDVQPNPILFENVRGLDRVQKQITFANRGLKLVTVDEPLIQQPGQDLQILANASFPLQLAAGAEAEAIAIQYQKRSEGPITATLLVTSDADNADDQRLIRIPIALSADALPALIALDPPAVDLTDVAPGESKTTPVTVSNPGGTALNITAIRMSTADDAPVPESDPEFEVVSGGSAVNVAPGDEHEVEVKFTRGAEDRLVHIGALIIDSNADTPRAVVYFTAEAPAAQ